MIMKVKSHVINLVKITQLGVYVVDYVIQACEWALKKNGNVVLLAGNGSLANLTATTRPSVC